jgi:hypothetical protein
VAPDSDAREEVALRVAAQLVGIELDDASLIDNAWRDVSCVDEVADPLSSIGVDLVVERSHAASAV